MKLTKKLIDSATAPSGKGWRFLPDDKVLGFGVRIYASGHKSFVIRYRNADGRQRFYTLGNYGVLTLQQARERARKKLVEVSEGEDPQAAKKSGLAAPTFGELCGEFMERHSKKRKKSWRDDQSRIDNYLVPSLGTRKAAGIKRSDVAALHEKIGERHAVLANRILELTRRIFVLAETWGLVPEDHPNPAVKIPKFPEVTRDRWVTEEEMPALAKSIDEEADIYVRAVLWMYLFTGGRKRELLNARWSNVDFDRSEIKFQHTKNRKDHVLPLSAPAIAILQDLPRAKGNPYVFPGRNEGRPIVNIDKAWRRVRKRAGVEDVRLHDLRRTVGSWLAQGGNSLLTIQKTLNHKSHAATLVYARMGEDPVRTALDAHAQKLMRVALGETAEVVELRGEK